MPPNLVERVSFRDTDHSYHLDGKRIPSVTTLLGNLSKPGLVWWAANMGADAVHAKVLATDAIDMVSLGPDAWGIFADELHHLARTAHNDRKNRAAEKGNVVHAAIEQFHANFWQAEPPTDAAALPAWEAFLAWWQFANLHCVSTERKIVDPDGRYAGRLDLLLADDDTDDAPLHVCDVKTSKGVYPEHVLQNAAYAAAVQAETGRLVATTRVLWIPDGATSIVEVTRDAQEWAADYAIFESLIALHRHRGALDRWLKDVREINAPKDDA